MNERKFGHQIKQQLDLALNLDAGTLNRLKAAREQALARMRIALSEMVVEGIQTNIPLHRDLLNDTRFLRGGVSIHHLEQKLAQEQGKKK